MLCSICESRFTMYLNLDSFNRISPQMCRCISSTTDYKIVTTAKLDREEQAEYHLVITCRDGGDDVIDQVSPRLVSSREIDVVVLDDNDHAPQFAQVARKIFLKHDVQSWCMLKAITSLLHDE